MADIVEKGKAKARSAVTGLENIGNAHIMQAIANILQQRSNPQGTPPSTTSQQVGPYTGPTYPNAPAAQPQSTGIFGRK